MPKYAQGLFAAVGAYVLWGFLPLYFKVLGDVAPLVILAHRIVWSVPTALILIAAAGKWGELTGLWRQPRVLFTLLASSLAIAANWTIYIWAVTNNRVLEGSLGYFINPLITSSSRPSSSANGSNRCSWQLSRSPRRGC
jgi:chloramphenicol-sensitive protein RarD